MLETPSRAYSHAEGFRAIVGAKIGAVLEKGGNDEHMREDLHVRLKAYVDRAEPGSLAAPGGGDAAVRRRHAPDGAVAVRFRFGGPLSSKPCAFIRRRRPFSTRRPSRRSSSRALWTKASAR